MWAHRVALYARVSTKEQTTANQLEELRRVCCQHGWAIVGEYSDDGVSGSKGREDRKALDQLMKDAMRKKFDRVCVWSVDRLGRSMKHLVVTLADLQAKQIVVYAHKQGIDTATPTGSLMWNFIGIFAEFERDMIRERVICGLARVRANGTRLGRPPSTDCRDEEIRSLRRQGVGLLKIGRTLGMGVGRVKRACAESIAQA